MEFCRFSLHSRIFSLSRARLLSLAGLRLRGMAGLAAVAVGIAEILHQKSTMTTPCLLTVSIVAQTPFSTHSSNRVSSRDCVKPAAGELLVGEEGVEAVPPCIYVIDAKVRNAALFTAFL